MAEVDKTYDKSYKQETYKSKRGNEYLFTYVGTKFVLQHVIGPNAGKNSQSALQEALMEYILEGDYDWDYWDKKVANTKKSDSIEVDDYDDTKVTYDFKFPGFKKLNELRDNATDDYGQIDISEYWKGLMDVVVQNDIDYDYWDHHDGIMQVMSAADNFLGEIAADSEFQEVMDAAEAFVNKYFR